MILRELHLTTRCNSRCKFCTRTTHPPIVRDIDFEVLENLPLFSWIVITSHNGEHTLYPRFLEVIEMFKYRGIKLSINTNGSTHNPEWWYKLGKLLGVEDKVIFSLDGLKEDHERYRPGVSFDKTIENMKSFNDAGGISFCNTVLFQHNEQDMWSIKKIADDIGCEKHRAKISWCYDDEFQRPISVEVNTRTETSKMNDYVTCEHLDCDGDMSVSLSPDGEYYPCCFILQAVENNTDKYLVDLYYRSKGKLRDLTTAINTPIFHYTPQYDICKKKCRGFICETAYKIEDQPKSKRDIIEIFKNYGKDFDISLYEISLIHKKYPNFNFSKYICMWDDIYPDVIKTIIQWDEVDAFGYSQYLSKRVIIEELRKYNFKNVMIIGSWVGLLARMIHDNFDCSVTTVDKDLSMSDPDAFLNRDYKLHLHLPLDVKTLDVDNGDVVINTSCEHMDDEWFHRTHSSQLLILQSTNKQGKDHINTVESLEEMKKKYPMSNILESRVLEVWNDPTNKRFMIIGNK